MRGCLAAVVGLAIGSACVAADSPNREQKPSDRLLRNARITLEVSCRAKRGESVLILTDRKPARMACAIALETAAEELGLMPVIMDVSVYGDWIEERPADKPLDAEAAILKPVKAAVEAADIAIRVGGCPRYGTILGDPDVDDRFLTAEDRRVSLYWRNIDQEDVTAEEVAAIRPRTTWLAEKLHTSKRIRVSTSAGTEFSAGVGPGAEWYSILGIVPLYGEVAVIPQVGPETEGVFVVDGPTYYGVRPQTETDRTPLRITVKAGYVEDIAGDAEQVARLKKAIAESGTPKMAIDEVGLVTTSIVANDACWSSSGTHRHDSIHIAVGDNFRRDELVHGAFHMDCEILRPTVWLDEQLIIKEGVFQDSVLGKERQPTSVVSANATNRLLDRVRVEAVSLLPDRYVPTRDSVQRSHGMYPRNLIRRAVWGCCSLAMTMGVLGVDVGSEAAQKLPVGNESVAAGEGERVSGVWHRSGVNRRAAPGTRTVYGGPHATYCAWTRPMAAYVPGQEKTFFVFGNAENSPAIAVYDHRQQTFSPAKVLGRNSDMDAHRNPHLLIDEKGYLYVFFGSHCSPTYLVKSVRPYDIEEWTAPSMVAVDSSYPQPWQLERDEIVVLFRQGGTHSAGQAVIRSSDGGKTWSAPNVFAVSPPANGFYAVSIAAQGTYPRRLHIAWSVTRGDWWQRYHVYYAYSDDGARTWRRSDGRPYTLPITESDAEQVFRSELPDRGVWLQDIQSDMGGNPYVLFVDGNTLTYDCTWRVARFLDSQWKVLPVTQTDHMYDSGALVFLADDDLRTYLPSTPAQDHEDGGDVDEWQSKDRGLSWTKTRAVTSGSRYSHNHMKTVYGHEKGDFRLFWSYGDSTDPPETRAVKLYYYGESLPGARQMPLVYAGSADQSPTMKQGKKEE